MGGTWENRGMYMKFFFLITEEGSHLKGLGVDTNFISKQLFLEIGDKNVHWIYFSKNIT